MEVWIALVFVCGLITEAKFGLEVLALEYEYKYREFEGCVTYSKAL